MFSLSKELIEHIEKETNFEVSIENNVATFTSYSGLGHENSFDVDLAQCEYIGDVLSQIYHYYNDYDVSSEVYIHLDYTGHCGGYSIVDLVEDFQEYEKSIDELYDVINDFANPNRGYADPNLRDYEVSFDVNGMYTVKVAASSFEDAANRAMDYINENGIDFNHINISVDKTHAAVSPCK